MLLRLSLQNIALIEKAEMPVKAILGKSIVSVNDFATLQPGDIIRLDRNVEDELDIYKRVHLTDPHLRGGFKLMKRGILDILVELENGTKINIEIQHKNMADWEKRQLYYLSRVYSQDLFAGVNYQRLQKSILISIDDFAKVEIKIGKILECEKIEKSNKLLKTQIDIGDKTIQVVAGLGKRYAPEDLVGKKVPVVTNLKPAKLMGEKSEGMIMATESAAILTPDDCEIGELLM